MIDEIALSVGDRVTWRCYPPMRMIPVFFPAEVVQLGPARVRIRVRTRTGERLVWVQPESLRRRED